MKYFAIIFFAFVLILPFTAAAHLAGQSKEDNNYRVELATIPEQELDIGEAISFLVSMERLNGDRIMSIRGWFRVSTEDEVLFSSSDFQTDDGVMDFSYTFVRPGDYELSLRVHDIQSDQEATVTYPLTIGAKDGAMDVKAQMQIRQTRIFGLITLILGGIGGAIIVYALQSRKKKSE